MTRNIWKRLETLVHEDLRQENSAGGPSRTVLS